MSKRKTTWSSSKYESFLKAKNWEKHGEEYESTFVIQSFPSTARVTRVQGNKVNKQYNLMNDLQFRILNLLEYVDDVVDIREHFPLVNLNEEINTSELKLEKFIDDGYETPYILTVTFMVTYSDGTSEAITVKSTKSLERDLTQRHCEAMRRYFNSKDIKFSIVTEKDFSRVEAENISFFMKSKFEIGDYGFSEANIYSYLTSLVDYVDNFSEKSILLTTKAFDKQFNLNEGSGMFLIKYMLSTKMFSIDLGKKLNPSKILCRDVKISHEVIDNASSKYVASI